MKTLILMRHAKSSWKHADLSDHERPLNNRGRRSAQALGRWMRAQNLIPDEVLLSDSVRTRETLAGLDCDAPAHLHPHMYHADVMTLMDSLCHATGTCVLAIGHNPGLADFASNIVTEAPDHPQFFFYPTGATLVAQFGLDSWRDLDWKTGTCTDFVIPRALLET